MKIQDSPIIIEEDYDTSKEILWNALTNINEMRKWFFENIPDFQPVVGFKTAFDVSSGERVFKHLWEIIEVIPNKKIKYNWKYADYSGNSFLSFELIPKENLTSIKLTIEITEDFSSDIPEFKVESCLGGWDYFLNNRLRKYLEYITE